MILYRPIIILAFLLGSIGNADERSEWLAERQGWLDRARSHRDSETFVNLARIIRGIGGNLTGASLEARALFQQAQTALVSIPGHADYFVNEIKQAKAHALSPEELSGRDGKISWSNYNRVRSAAFDTLEHLPSVETLRALGEFLGDKETPNAVRPGDEAPDTLGPGSNSGLAIMALRILIQDPPVKSENDYLEHGEEKVWQQWYEQIKAGNRTFRFEGNPTEYDLNGPAPKDKLVRIKRDWKRDEERVAGHRKSGPASESAAVVPQLRKPSTIAGILAACALVAGAVWYFLRGRRPA